MMSVTGHRPIIADRPETGFARARRGTLARYGDTAGSPVIQNRQATSAARLTPTRGPRLMPGTPEGRDIPADGDDLAGRDRSRGGSPAGGSRDGAARGRPGGSTRNGSGRIAYVGAVERAVDAERLAEPGRAARQIDLADASTGA